MNIVDIIEKKRDFEGLSEDEINFFVTGYSRGDIDDYQISALLMAIYLNGMSITETRHLTMAMLNSGEVLDFSHLEGAKIDKHSTGGVGDKPSMIIGPICAALGGQSSDDCWQRFRAHRWHAR